MSATDKLFNDERRVYLMGACVRRESHAQFCEGPEVQFLRPTHQNYRDLKQEVGLGAFEGRSWRGFHHHVTLCIAAYGYLMLCRCRTMPLAGGRAAAPSFPHVTDPREPPVRPERHNPHSIATQRRRLIIHLARRLPRCPCCHTRKNQMAQFTQPEMASR
jgi:hypothetical protein